MKRLLIPAVVAGVLAFGAALAHAKPEGEFSTEGILKEMGSIKTVVFAGIVVIYVGVAAATIIGRVGEARRTGEWGGVLVAIAVSLIAGLAIWGLFSWMGEDPAKLTNEIRVKATQ